jgi:hypothetical protein
MDCPYVKDVTVRGDYLQDEDWRYFETALMNTNTWKLHIFSIGPVAYALYCFKPRYFNCAYHLCDSLRELTLTTGMIS